MQTVIPHRRFRRCIRHIALAAFIFLVIIAPLPAGAHEIVVITGSDLKPYQEARRGFLDAYGRDVREIRLRGDEDGSRIIQQSPDAVVAIGTTAFTKVRSAKKLPVIYLMVVPSETAMPLPPNMSGVSMEIAPDHYIAAIKRLFPGAKRIGLLYDPRHAASFVAKAAASAKAAGLDLAVGQVRDAREIPHALRELSGMDLFWMLPDPTVVTPDSVDYLLRFSFQYRVPILSFSRKYVEMGAVAALDVDPYDMGAQAGEIMKDLSAGRAVAAQVYARKGRLLINKKVATKMGVRMQIAGFEGVENVTEK